MLVRDEVPQFPAKLIFTRAVVVFLLLYPSIVRHSRISSTLLGVTKMRMV